MTSTNQSTMMVIHFLLQFATVHAERTLFTCESVVVNGTRARAFWMVSACSSNWLDETGESGQRTVDKCINSRKGELPPATDMMFIQGPSTKTSIVLSAIMSLNV